MPLSPFEEHRRQESESRVFITSVLAALGLAAVAFAEPAPARKAAMASTANDAQWISSAASVTTAAAVATARATSNPAAAPLAPPLTNVETGHPLDPALELIRKCEDQLTRVRDYSAVFVKQERFGKQLAPVQTIEAKFRVQPHSVYFRWVNPEAGKEAIFIDGENDNKIISHVTGIARVFTGTMRLDPEGSLARQGNRHSIREAGVHNLVGKLRRRWEFEKQYQETEVDIKHMKINNAPCWLITTVHPRPDEGKYMFHTCKVYIDKQLLLPVRIEGYAYGEQPGRVSGPMVECYTYLNLRVNVGLTDLDFSPRNPAYSYPRG